MGWWKKLKPWYKAGFIVGSLHLVVYMIILFLFPPVAGYFLVFMEAPWMWLLLLVGIGPGSIGRMALIGIISTVLYGLSVMAISQIFYTLCRKFPSAR